MRGLVPRVHVSGRTDAAPVASPPIAAFAFCAPLLRKKRVGTTRRASDPIVTLQSSRAFVIARHHRGAPFPGSSVVEQPAVNRLVAGSNPARGASFRKMSLSVRVTLR